jgi:Sigma-70 region 2
LTGQRSLTERSKDRADQRDGQHVDPDEGNAGEATTQHQAAAQSWWLLPPRWRDWAPARQRSSATNRAWPRVSDWHKRATFCLFPAYFYLKGECLVTRDSRHDDLTAFLATRGDALLRTAVLLAPGREAGEDLLQEALERLLRNWHKIDGDPEAYLRRIMYNRAVDGWRTRARRKELLGHPVEAVVADHASGLDLRLALISAPALLTPRQRAAIVGATGSSSARRRPRRPSAARSVR